MIFKAIRESHDLQRDLCRKLTASRRDMAARQVLFLQLKVELRAHYERNPWTKHNPFMSMWLSAANSVAGSARSRLTAPSKRQVAAMMTRGTAQAADFWMKVLTTPTVVKNGASLDRANLTSP